MDFHTRRQPYPVLKSHLNGVVPGTVKWEQFAAYQLDTHEQVHSFVKNEGLGCAIPYLYNGEQHEYLPDFLIRLRRHCCPINFALLGSLDPLPLVSCD